MRTVGGTYEDGRQEADPHGLPEPWTTLPLSLGRVLGDRFDHLVEREDSRRTRPATTQSATGRSARAMMISAIRSIVIPYRPTYRDE